MSEDDGVPNDGDAAKDVLLSKVANVEVFVSSATDDVAFDNAMAANDDDGDAAKSFESPKENVSFCGSDSSS